MLLSRILLVPDKVKHVADFYPLLAPESISIQVDGRLEKLDAHTMFVFLLNVFFSLWYGYLPYQVAFLEGITAAGLFELLAKLPDAVLPVMKKKQAYISRYLSANEVDKSALRNRKLFKRLKRGHYILNPALKIRLGDNWHDLHAILTFEGWDHQLEAAHPMSDESVRLSRKEYFDQQIARFKSNFGSA